MKNLHTLILFFVSAILFAQNKDTISNPTLTLTEYIAMVKKHHPMVKQANLKISEAEAKLLKARGAFDPKIEFNQDKKDFKNKIYYDHLYTGIKIPTWYGVEFKAVYERNTGDYLNPEMNTPDQGLYSAGVSVSLLKDLIINDRMAILKQAKYYQEIQKSERDLLVNEILYKAVDAYLVWHKKYQTYLLYKTYIENAEFRLKNVKKSHELGYKPAVDTLEASINLKSRILETENARIDLIKAQLETSNYLWIDDFTPVELDEQMQPNTTNLGQEIQQIAYRTELLGEEWIANHPKMKALNFKRKQLDIERQLSMNNLLPELNVQYNILSSDYAVNSFNPNHYKGSIRFSMPIFLRKQRSDYQVAKLKMLDIDFSISTEQVALKNKVEATLQSINSYKQQQNIINQLVKDYRTMLSAEEKRFVLGEGSLFLINYREVKLIEAGLKKIDVDYKLYNSEIKLNQQLNTW